MVIQRRSYKDVFLVLLCILMLGAGGFYVAINTVTPPSAPAPAPTSAIGDSPAPLPISANVNLAPYSEMKEFYNPKYLSATEGSAHASAAILLSEGQTVTLTLESDCPIDWYSNWDYPGSPFIKVMFAQMRTYMEDSGWVTISSGAIDVKHTRSSNQDRKREIILSPTETNISTIYKLLAVNLDPDSPHYLKYSISSHTGVIFTTLNVSINPLEGGSVSPSGGQYESNTQVTLTAAPSSGHRFDRWSGDVSGTNPTITITMNSDKSVIANFTAIRYRLSTSVSPPESGSVSPSSGTYDSGTQVTLSATPSSGHRFDRWSGDVSGTNPTITITMNSDKSVIANFSRIWYSLSTSVSPPGSGSISPSSGAYDSGTQVTLTATPRSLWKFDHWSGTDDNSVNPTTVTMTGAKNVTAYFVAKDTDGDGLTDEEEQQIGTNPGYADTDHDGLSDYEEVKVKKTDPLNPDTDDDGVKDGNDLFPFYDAYVKVAIKYFEDTSATGQGPDQGGLGDPYFIIRAGSLQKTSQKPIGNSVSSRHNPFSAVFNVPDDNQFVLISVEVWDYDGGWTEDEQYDASSAPGSDPEFLIYKKRFDTLGGTSTETSDGAADGSLQGPQAKIIVEIGTVPQQ